MTEITRLTDRADVREIVREKYGAAALTVLEGKGAACCGGNAGGGDSCCGGDTITGGLYDAVEAASIPEAALLASLGCGNPTALAQLNPGETVLDLGSGGGIDVLLSAKRVGPTGFAYGLDMTDEMLALAEKNKFVDASIEPTRRYTFADLEATTCCTLEVAALPAEEKAALDGRVMGAFIRAAKPSASCCGPDCCQPKG